MTTHVREIVRLKGKHTEAIAKGTIENYWDGISAKLGRRLILLEVTFFVFVNDAMLLTREQGSAAL